MKLLLEIKDNKADFILELLENFKFVKTKAVTSDNSDYLKELQGSVEQVNLAKEGKIKLKSARELLDEI